MAREIRDWLTLAFTILSVAILPICWLAMRNQRLEIREEMRQGYVSLEVFRADHNAMMTEIAKRDGEIISMNAKLDRLTVSIARLMDAVKLRDSQ